MLIAGSLLALLCGLSNSIAALLEKLEGMRVPGDVQGLRLLRVLVHKPLWLVGMVLSAVAWAFEAVSLAIAPVPVVATLRTGGRGLLIPLGAKWLDEEFGKIELVAVAMATGGGGITALGSTGSSVTLRPLSNLDEVWVALGVVVVALALSRLSSGGGKGAAVGCLFIGTGVFTKEIADRFAYSGLQGLELIVASVGFWVMVPLTVWSQNLLQGAFRRANAATVSAATTAVSALGLIIVGFTVYGERFPTGWRAAVLVIGVLISVSGTVILAVVAKNPTPVPIPSAIATPEEDRAEDAGEGSGSARREEAGSARREGAGSARREEAGSARREGAGEGAEHGGWHRSAVGGDERQQP